MDALSALFIIVLPVFMVVGAGYGAVRVGMFPDAGLDHLVRFATNIAVPVLLFRAMYDLNLGRALDPGHLGAFYGSATAVFFIVMALSRKFWKRRPGESVAVGFCALFSNSVLLGLPIMNRAYGEASLEPVYAIVALNAPYCYLLGILTMELLRRDGSPMRVAFQRTGAAIFRNALTISILLGLAVNLSGVRFPEPVVAGIDLMARAALPVALFGMGGVLTRYSIKAEFSEAAMIAAVSLIAHPALAWVLAEHVLGLDEEFVRAAVVVAAMPTGINGYVFASMYNRAVGTAASSVIIGTAGSILTITAWLAFLGGARLG